MYNRYETVPVLVIVITMILCIGIVMFPMADYSSDKNLATFSNMTITALEKEGSKSKTYYVSMSGGNVKNLRISVNGETWERLHTGDKISFVYDMGWKKIVEWK